MRAMTATKLVVDPRLAEAPEIVGGCRIIRLPKIADVRGNLSFIEGGRHIP